jgi:putative cell wall-binding protein
MSEKTDRPARMGRLWRNGIAVTAAVTLGSFVAGVAPAHATTAVTTSRIAGVNRYATAAEIAEAKYPTGASAAILASGLNFPDALAAGYLAGLQGAPILLTDPATLSPETQAAFQALKTQTVTIVGGTGAVADAVATAVAALTSTGPLGGNISVTRIFGASRYDTMQLIDQSAPATQVGIFQGKATAIIAQGLDFADALSASGVAFKDHLPVILTDPAMLPLQTQQTLTALNIGQVLIMGGTAAVSPTVEQAINAMGIATLHRFSGVDRTDTAQQFAQYSVANLKFSNSEVVLTRGDLFADALAGGVYAGDPKPILLTEDPNTLGVYTANYLTQFSSFISRITVLGGQSAVADATLTAAAVAAASNGNGGGGNVGTGGGNIGGGGGNGGAGGVFPAPTPTTNGPDLVSAAITFNGFNNGQPSQIQYTFDKSIAAIVPGAFGILGPDLAAPSGVVAPLGCVIDPNGIAADCQFGAGVNVVARTIAKVDGRGVTGSNGATVGTLKNVLSAVTLSGGNNAVLPQPALVPSGCSVSSVAFNQINYTFNQPVVPNPALTLALAAQKFGFGTVDGQTENIGGVTFVTATNSVTVTFPVSNAVSQANYCFVLPGAVVGAASGVANVITDAGTLPSSRPNVISVQRMTLPNQFLFTVDKPSVFGSPGTAAANFVVYQNESVPTPIAGVFVSVQSSTQFIVTFPTGAGPGTINTGNTSTFVWGALTQTIPPTVPPAQPTPTAGALRAAAAPNAFNAVGAVAIGGASTAIANGPVLQSCTASIATAQATFTFDRPINVGSVVPTGFFVVNVSSLVVGGVATAGVTNNNVVIQFPAAAITSATVGCGLVGPFGVQPGIGTPGPAVVATDSSGNPALGTSVAGTAS